MTARCHNDSCSIAWDEVNTLSGPAFEARVVLDADGGLVCTDDQGVGVLIDPVAGNALSVSATGLKVLFPAAVVETLSGNPANKGVAPSADSGSTQSSDTYSWTNATGRDAIVLVSGELNFRYGVLEDAHSYAYAAGNGQRVAAVGGAVPFNAQVAMRFLADVGAAPTTSRKAVRVGIGGMAVTPTAGADRALVKTERVPFMSFIRVANGATLNMKSDAFFEGPDQTVNIGAAPGVGGADLVGSGHELWNLQVVAVPL